MNTSTSSQPTTSKSAARESMEITVIINILANILCTVGCVLANKYLWVEYKFKYMITLSCIHFLFTSLGTRILMMNNFFIFKDAPTLGVLPVALGSLGSVAFMNLNLAFNSVGFYQISKLVCIPITLVLQYYMFGDIVSNMIQGSLVIILIGVGIATFSDVELNMMGSVFAIIAICCTALAQIFTHSKPKELGLDSMQLLYHAAPMISVGMFLLIPVGYVLPGFDILSGPDSLFNYQMTSEVVFWILLSSALAFGVNVTNYLVISNTSPDTYQVGGQLKTCINVVLSFVVVQYQLLFITGVRIFIAIVGMIWYTELKRKESSTPAPVAYTKVAVKEDIELENKN